MLVFLFVDLALHRFRLDFLFFHVAVVLVVIMLVVFLLFEASVEMGPTLLVEILDLENSVESMGLDQS